MSAEPTNFEGHCSWVEHRTTGGRAWCLGCGEWCYQTIPCSCCTIGLAQENPCPHCQGTGINPGSKTTTDQEAE